MVKIVHNVFLLVWACSVLVHGADVNSLEFELISDVEIEKCADTNPDNGCFSYSGIPDVLPRANVQNDASNVRQNVLQENQALGNSRLLDMSALSTAVNSVEVNEGFSVSASSSASLSLSLPGTSTSTSTSTVTDSSISSLQVQPSAGSAKRACDTEVKEDGEQRARKRQKTSASEGNTALMDEAEVCMAVKEFNRRFGDGKKVMSHTPPGIAEFVKNLAQRALTSAHSSKIVELCTASEEWRGHSVFWILLMFFMDTMCLEIADLNRTENKKTVVLRDRKIYGKPLSKCTKDYIYKNTDKFRVAEQIEIQCSLSILESRGTENVLAVFRWLLYHVKIECVGITCDLRKTEMSSNTLRRQMTALTKEWRERRVRIDSLFLCIDPAEYMDATTVVKECSSIPVLKIHFIDADLWQIDDRKQELEALLLHCPALKELSLFGVCANISHIRMITATLPHLVHLEVGVLSLDNLVLDQKKEKESMPVFPGLKTLKLPSMYNYSYASIEKLVDVFPNLKCVQISAKNITSLLIYALSKLPLLRSLEIVNSFLSVETAEYLLEKLPSLECFSFGVKELDRTLAHGLSKHAGIHTLNLKGRYTPDFLSSLLQPSPLMSTLKVLCLWRNSGSSYRGKFSTKDLSSKKTAMMKFGCAVKIKH
ncbi:hypothetical protein NECID01_2134 [Nematocida sp. AWRm77]|nr:hypothetical protein NECID01_2134 [Nematocida sp. AWRm77]